MKKEGNVFTKGSTRRSFLKNGTVAGAATMGAGLLAGNTFAFDAKDEDGRASITKGDIAILRFLQALEAVEEDLWRQYAELGGTQDNEFSGLTGGNAAIHKRCNSSTGTCRNTSTTIPTTRFSHAGFLALPGIQGCGVCLTSPSSRCCRAVRRMARSRPPGASRILPN